MEKIDLSGEWGFALDPEKKCPQPPYGDTMPLPGTTAYFHKGKFNETAETGHLTEEYPFEGSAWFSREIEIKDDLSKNSCFLFLERTRVTTVWLNGKGLGTQNSLCAPHVYDVTGLLPKGKHTVTLCVDNASLPTKGGHMTSPDTQTNWNGVTGRIELQVFPQAFLKGIRLTPDAADRYVTVEAEFCGAAEGTLAVSAESFNSAKQHTPPSAEFPVRCGHICLRYPLGEDALLWSEHEPNLYRLHLMLTANGEADTEEAVFGLRDFKTADGKFTINGNKTFLRGKHEGLLFPLTGFAPTELEPWLRKLKISKEYGINHYRFHTCCPPEAAFTAADLLGVYMEPELPFWGTVPEKDDPKADPAEWDYLTEEGFRILRTFGNHPSFVMMSLGNELWGSKTRLEEILTAYHTFDGSRLYTQGSNNFQFCPAILPHDDFFCGVRFSRERLIRGSYGMCDAPLGHVQTGVPGPSADYDAAILPPEDSEKAQASGGGAIQIQYGTGTKTVEADAAGNGPVPTVPVVSHEIGEYAVYPDFREIEKYTGPLKARNFEVFRRRLEEKGLGSLAEKYFRCSGKLAASCYREELEAAFRSNRLAGFQILDLQDYSGQGSALVGMLNAFMESKGLISPEEWRSFCSDAVLLARFPKFLYVPGEKFHAHIQLRYDCTVPLHEFAVTWTMKDEKNVLSSGQIEVKNTQETFLDVGDIDFFMPETNVMKKLMLVLESKMPALNKEYNLWLCPADIALNPDGLNVFHRPSEEMFSILRDGGNAVLFPSPETLKDSVEGTYCTDFWCYAMFRSISESMGKPDPVGTMGLLIQNRHPALRAFPCEEYSTEPWRSIVTDSRALVLDKTPKELLPIVQVIDNFERNHKLGLLFECRVLNGNLLICTCDISKLSANPEGRLFLSSLLDYARSEDFHPNVSLTVPCVEDLFR